MPLSTTSLLKSAASRRAKIRSMEDAEVAFQWERSAQTYEDYVAYSKFLEGRAQGVSDPTEQLTYRRKLQSANRSYTSNELQRQSQAISQGRGSLGQKKDALIGLYQRAVANGDMNLAQNLVSQWDSLDIQEQNAAESAAAAQERLFNAQERLAKKTGAGYASIADSLENGLENLSQAFEEGGQTAYNKAAKKFVDTHRDTLKEMGIDLPADYSTNIGQLISGVVNGIGEYYSLASQATALDSPEDSQRYDEKVNAILSGKKEFTTPAGKMNQFQLEDMSLNPQLYIESTNAEGKTELKKSTLAGLTRDSLGNIIGIPSGNTQAQVEKKDQDKAIKQLEKLGFGNVRFENGVYKVKLSTSTPSWLSPDIIGKTKNSEFEVIPTSTGFSFQQNDRLFNIGFDTKGLGGLYEVSRNNEIRHLGGDYGFNQFGNTAVRNRADVNWTSPTKRPLGTAPVPVLQPRTATQIGDPLNVLGRINQAGGRGKPSMTQRAGGGFNFVNSSGQPISAYTYARLTGQSFRSVLSTSAARGDTFAATALKYAGNDGAYNPATVDAGTAKNWTSLIWGNNINLQTAQSLRQPGQQANYVPPILR